eukprot:CAMPEP_0172892900 /NCGR_PEP_ID=MMETSP1075-20121228/147253_1 /TAXON_ID=2916 /ORGANISM="Ceratium fusus, Strain PA161109" /LENGTH=457 /DNA_ID=CAMNT_0013747663 /DNA_START=85 /DNA_END=1455 /DNA_ORIENTATION=-
MISGWGYSTLRVPELQRLCEQRGLLAEGFKQLLVQRLEEQDKHRGLAAQAFAQTFISREQTGSVLPSVPLPVPPPPPVHTLGIQGDAVELNGAAHWKAQPPPQVPWRKQVPGQCDQPPSASVQGANGAVGSVVAQGTRAVHEELHGLNGSMPQGTQVKQLGAGHLKSWSSAVCSRPTAVKSMPAVAAQAAAAAAAASGPQKGRTTELTEEERILRGMLEFFVCSDIERVKSQTPLPIKYRDFIVSSFDVLQHRSHVHEVTATLPHSLVGKLQQTACQSSSELLTPQNDRMPSQLFAEARPPCPLPGAATTSPSQQQRVTSVSQMGANAASTTAPATFVSATARTQSDCTHGEKEATIPQICMSRKRPLEATGTREQTDLRETLRRKAEKVVDAQVALAQLLVQRDALAAQVRVVSQAIDQKAAESRRMREQLRQLSSDEDKQRNSLQAKVRLRTDAW